MSAVVYFSRDNHLLVRYAFSLHTGSGQWNLLADTHSKDVLSGRSVSRHIGGQKYFFFLYLFSGLILKQQKEKIENLKHNTSVSLCQDCFSPAGKDQELQSIKYSMATTLCNCKCQIALDCLCLQVQ